MGKTISIFLLIQALTMPAMAAGPMGTFLKNCAYGTLGGAALGLATLAISDNPGSKISNVARGASLGLYAGIGYGFYVLEKNREPQTRTEPDIDVSNTIYFSPIANREKIEGLQVNWLSVSF